MSPRPRIGAKLRPPPPVPFDLDRPRVQAALARAAAMHQVVLIVAGAGSGKTTEAARFFQSRGERKAWLSLDRGDHSPTRFLSYLAAALGCAEPALEAMVDELLADGMLADDCAALLAEHLGSGWTIVVDDLHHVESDAPSLGLLRTFIRALPNGVVVVLVSRQLPALDLSAELLRANLGGLFDADLAFDLEETGSLLERRGASIDPDAVWRATGGWAAGIVFEALRGAGERPGLPPAEDPLFSYLAGEVIDRLPGRLRRAVLRSAVLDVVTAARLMALPQEDPPVLLDEIARLHLPSTIDGAGLRYHPQVREFLEHRLHRELQPEIPRLLEAYGQSLAGEGYVEEAVDTLLLAGRPRQAAALAEQAVTSLRRRADWNKLLSWIESLGEEVVRTSPVLREAQVRALLNSRRQHELENLVHHMMADGELSEQLEDAPDAAAWAVWALHGSGEWAKLLPLLPQRGRSAVAEVMRYMLASTVARDPPPELKPDALDRTHPLHVVLLEALYFQGRFDAVDRLAAVAATRGGPVTAAVAQAHKVNVLRARGELAAARRVLESVPSTIRRSRFVEFWLHAEAELTLEEGNGERAIELIRSARETSARHGWRVGDGAIFGAVEGRMLVRLGRFDEAVGVLTRVGKWSGDRALTAFREWADAWHGAALLLSDGPLGRAHGLLETAVAGMERARRHLELPAAAIFLAEAKWRLADEDAHDAASDLGYRAAEACGTLMPLMRAIDLFPDVLARRLDSEAPGGDRRWARLVPSRSAQPPRWHSEDAALRIRTLGPPGIELNGVILEGVPPKAVELAAAVARAGPPGVLRSQLINSLFTESRDGPNYLRQLAYRLRRVVTRGVILRSTGRRLAWEPAEHVTADDALLESLAGRARTETGAARERTLAHAFRLAQRGSFLEGLDEESVVGRRQEMLSVAVAVSLEYARSMRVAGQPAQALAALEGALAADPYREEAWQELMRVQAGLEGPAAVGKVFLDCRRSLDDVGLAPSRETLELVEHLRR